MKIEKFMVYLEKILCRLQGIYSALKGSPLIPLAILMMFFFVAIFAPILAPYDPNKGELSRQFIAPFWTAKGSVSHLLGTDMFGRDILSRLIYGARVSLTISLITILLSASFGTAVGIISGYFGGWIDLTLMRVVDMAFSFPLILMAIVLAAVFGPSLFNVILVVTLLFWPRYARQIRGETLGIKERDFVALARVAGCSNGRIMLRHIFPNVVPTLLVLTTFEVASVILLEATLSFLGVGIPPPTASWGTMVAEGRTFIASYWWMSLFPGLAILLDVLSINLVGDWLRDRLDPKLRQI